MALIFGASSPFGTIPGVSTQSSSKMEEHDEHLGRDADGKIEKRCFSNERTPASMEGAVNVCAGDTGVDVSIDLGAELNGFFMESASLSQRNTDFPRINFGGTEYAGVVVDDSTLYTVEFTGLKYGVHFTPGITGLTLSRCSECSVNWSINDRAEAVDNVGQMSDLRGITYRGESTGTALKDADTWTPESADWDLLKGEDTVNTAYVPVKWRSTIYVNP